MILSPSMISFNQIDFPKASSKNHKIQIKLKLNSSGNKEEIFDSVFKIPSLNYSAQSYKRIILGDSSNDLDQKLLFELSINHTTSQIKNFHKFGFNYFYLNSNYLVENIPIVEDKSFIVCGYNEFVPKIHKFSFNLQYFDKIQRINLGYIVDKVT